MEEGKNDAEKASSAFKRHMLKQLETQSTMRRAFGQFLRWEQELATMVRRNSWAAFEAGCLLGHADLAGIEWAWIDLTQLSNPKP